MNIGELLSHRINISQVKFVVAQVSGSSDNLSHLWDLVNAEDRKTGANALWIMTHLTHTDPAWIQSKREILIDKLLVESDIAKKRMLLQILREIKFEAEDIRTDLLDFCFSKINAECEPYAVRCFCIYTAFNMCRYYPELIAELEQHLKMLDYQELSPGLKSALRQTKEKISKL